MAGFDKFFFRTATNNQASGIMYLALSADNYGSFMCRGGRQLGTEGDGQTVWYIAGHGGYSDAMPEAAMMNQQFVSDIRELPKGTAASLIKKYKLKGSDLYFQMVKATGL